MKKMSTETKYFLYDLLMVIASFVAMSGAIVACFRWMDTLIHIHLWLGILAVLGTCGLIYWTFSCIYWFAGGEPEEEDR